MQRDGKYIYCIVASGYDSNFGPIGVGGRGDLVTTIGFDGLCMVVSDHPLNDFVVSTENMLAHQKVIEAVMKEFNSVLPLRFGIIAATPDEIRNLLNRRYSEFSELLRTFENKVEVNVKCMWKNIDRIYREIEEENAAFKTIKKEVNEAGNEGLLRAKLEEAGKLVEKSLLEKKEKKGDEILQAFKKSVFEFKQNKTIGDAMFFNTAFLINSGREKEVDNIIMELGEKYKDSIDFTYTSPLPIFNFIDLKIFPEKWEV